MRLPNRSTVIGIAAVMALSACGGTEPEVAPGAAATAADAQQEASDQAAGSDNAADDGETIDGGTITVGERTFTFNPRTCWVRDEDSEVNGPGREVGGEPVYVDFSGDGPGAGSIRIELGTDQPFETSERNITADRYVTEALAVSIDGLDVTATGLFRDEHGEDHRGQLSFDCR